MARDLSEDGSNANDNRQVICRIWGAYLSDAKSISIQLGKHIFSTRKGYLFELVDVQVDTEDEASPYTELVLEKRKFLGFTLCQYQ